MIIALTFLWANFLENRFLTYHANCQTLFSGKKYEKYFNMLSAKIYQERKTLCKIEYSGSWIDYSGSY